MAAIVGAGEAARIAREELPRENARLVGLRERLIEGLTERTANVQIVGHRIQRLPGHVALILDGQEGEAIRLLLALDEEGIAISTGSACSARQASAPSHVLMAMGFDPIRARGVLRISMGRFNDSCDVDRFLDVFQRVARSLRPVTTRHFTSPQSISDRSEA